MHPLTQTFSKIVNTPLEVASLVAGGCGCPDEATGSFAMQNPSAEMGGVTWSGVIGTEDELTGDGRMIEMNALRWESLPLPLRYAPVDTGGHQGAQVVGRIMTIERRDNGDLFGTGDIDMSTPLGPAAARALASGAENGVSMDLDDVSFDIRIKKDVMDEMNKELAEDPPQLDPVEPGTDAENRVTIISMQSDDEVMVTTGGRMRAATIVSIPAFINARLTLDDPEVEIPDTDPEDVALVASGAPVAPPAAWFRDPQLAGPTPMTITEDGRIYGHLAVWGTCHTGFQKRCVEPPHSPSGYAYFMTGAILTKEGIEIPVGQITLDTLHADGTLSAKAALSHYEDTGKAVSDIAVGEDAYGIWFAGAMRPGVSDARIRELRASPLSGDWRRLGGALELVASLAVNMQGFPVPRTQGLVASGAMQSLVASGVLQPEPTAAVATIGEFDINGFADAVLDRMESRQRRQTAEQLAQRIKKQRADALAKRVQAVR